MEQGSAINVWFDQPGDFLEIVWCNQWAVNSYQFPDTDYWFEVHRTEDLQATGFHVIGALHFARRYDSETVLVADVQPHPLTVKYKPSADQWDVQWGPGAVASVDTPNSRIKAKVDADGNIQGVLISDLHTFEDEILNQDIYPVKPAPSATWRRLP